MNTAASLITLDVREILRAGGEPFSEIMQAVAALAPGQGLRLLATFKPVPLFGVMAERGFDYAEREIGRGDWEVVFTPVEAGEGQPTAPGEHATPANAPLQPAGGACLDLRGLMPPEPMQRALEAVEALAAGESLQVLTDREPAHLFQELGRRGHGYVSDRFPQGGYRTTIRHGGGAGDRP